MVKDEAGIMKNGYMLVLLFSFLLGALMTLIYLDSVKTLTDRPICIMALLLAANCLLATSLIGLVIIPVLTVAFGSSTALELDILRSLMLAGFDKIPPEATMLLILTPIYFYIAFWGMNCSAYIRQSFVQRKKSYGKYRIIPYAIMFIGACSIYLLHRYIVNI